MLDNGKSHFNGYWSICYGWWPAPMWCSSLILLEFWEKPWWMMDYDGIWGVLQIGDLANRLLIIQNDYYWMLGGYPSIIAYYPLLLTSLFTMACHVDVREQTMSIARRWCLYFLGLLTPPGMLLLYTGWNALGPIGVFKSLEHRSCQCVNCSKGSVNDWSLLDFSTTQALQL